MTPDMLPMPVTEAEWVYYAVFGSLLSVLVVVLLSIVIYFLRRMVKGQDDLKAVVNKWITRSAVDGQKLDDHIGNEGVHCKGANCYERRTA
jgi:hypothetical protein